MSNDVDIVITDKVLDYPQIKTDNITANEFQEMLICEKISSAPWGKLFRKNLFNSYTFDIPRKIIMGEDLIMNLRLTSYCRSRIGVVHIPVYHYNSHTDNICHNFKDSAEHEYLFYSSIRNLLTEHSSHIISRSLKKWDRQFGYSYKKPLWFGSKIHQALIDDIERYNYKISWIEYTLLTTSNSAIRFIIIFIKKCKNKIKSL